MYTWELNKSGEGGLAYHAENYSLRVCPCPDRRGAYYLQLTDSQRNRQLCNMPIIEKGALDMLRVPKTQPEYLKCVTTTHPLENQVFYWAMLKKRENAWALYFARESNTCFRRIISCPAPKLVVGAIAHKADRH